MTPILIESFELYRPEQGGSFADYLRECGYTVAGEPAFSLDRTGFAQAADLSDGGFQYPVQTSDTVVSFGFAARYTAPGTAWQGHDSLGLHLGPIPRLNGVEAVIEIPAGTWTYYEIVILKETSTIQLFVNDTLRLTVPMPSALRFLTSYHPRFLPLAGLIVDDVAVAIQDRAGPIAVRAYYPDLDLPWSGDTMGQSVQGRIEEPVEAADIKAVTVGSQVSRTDLDGRETAVFAGSQERAIVSDINPGYRRGVFATRPDGSPWTESAVNATDFGLRITR